MDNNHFSDLMSEVRRCQLCRQSLPFKPRPILQASTSCKILIAGQAPGKVTHQQCKPFDDKSGERLRQWLNVDEATFYNDSTFAILPMGFCYPGTGVAGDLPPLAACASTWRNKLLAAIPNIQLTILLGKYAINWHLSKLDIPEISNGTITDVVAQYERLLAHNVIALPHPSPRNNRWLKKNPWFEQNVIPLLQQRVLKILNTTIDI